MPADQLDGFGRSGLHYAAVDADPTEVRLQLSLGAYVNLRDREGWTPLHFAAQVRCLEIAELLINAGAEVDAKDEHGNSPLFRAVFNYRGQSDGLLIRFLRSCGADPLAINHYGNSPVSLARRIANYDVAACFEDIVT